MTDKPSRRTLAGIPLISATIPVVCLALASQIAARPAQKAVPVPKFNTLVRPFFAEHCLSCHSSQFSSGGLNLEPFQKSDSIAKNSHTWESIVQKVRGGEMPPPGSPRPPAAQVKSVTDLIQGEIDRVQKQIKPEAGRVTARRLNRAEYNNSVRDLLGVDLRPADDFPQDDSGYGFDNIGDVLSLSPVLMEKYLGAAEKVARTAIFGPEPLKSSLTQIRMPRRAGPPNPTIPMEYDHSGLTLPNAIHTSYRFPVDAEYAPRVVLTGQRAPASEPMKLGLWVDGKMVQQISYDPQGAVSFPGEPQELAGLTATFPNIRIPAGEHWIAVTMLDMYEGLPPSYGASNPSKRPEPPPRVATAAPPTNATPEQLAQQQETLQKRARQRKASLANATKLFVLEMSGPYKQTKGPSLASKKLLYTCGHRNGQHQPTCTQKILSDFARRAFRRPLRTGELAPYVRLFKLAQSQQEPFEEGLCVAIQAMLVSPNFLFRVEHDAPASASARSYPINQHELATRLSYFLWSSMPDAELMRCADARTLRNPKVLEAQVRRMLRDPKADALVENFAGQWLELRKLESIKPDLDRFPGFDEYLRLSMRRETELFTAHIVQNDGNILDFIDGNYSFVNERLARFYQIPGVVGPEFRRVDLKGTPRGGVLTQASVLTVSSYATRTSPVLRGKWILENFLNAAPPPPPPDVPAIDETKVGTSATLRQQMEEHRKKPLCASCHSKMDPLGFGLENFDAIGGWRTQDGKFPIEASGTLPSGESFTGPKELETILKKDRNAFTECLTEKLLTYGLGRGLEPYDRPTVKHITRNVAKSDYRFSRLVLEIVDSLPFQQRKGTPTL